MAEPDFGWRFRAANDYAVAQGFTAGLPTGWHADYGDARGRVYGHKLLRSSAAAFLDAPAAALGGWSSLRERWTRHHDEAVRRGFVGSFPTMHQGVRSDGSAVFGMMCLPPGVWRWQDVPAAQLGYPHPDDMLAVLRAVDAWGARSGMFAAVPSGHVAGQGSARVHGVVSLSGGGHGEFRDVPGRDLGFPPSLAWDQPPEIKTLCINCFSGNRDPGLGRIASVMREADIVLAQEIGPDQVPTLAGLSGHAHYWYEPTIWKVFWLFGSLPTGNAIFSRWPLLERVAHEIPESRAIDKRRHIAEALVNIGPARQIRVFNTRYPHDGYWDPTDPSTEDLAKAQNSRREAARLMQRLLSARGDQEVVLAGDFNNNGPESQLRETRTGMVAASFPDEPNSLEDAVEHTFLRGGRLVSYERRHDDGVSDHDFTYTRHVRASHLGESLGVPGSPLTSAPSAVSMGQNHLDVYVRAGDNAVWHRWFAGHWGPWETVGGVLTSAPAAVAWPGLIDVVGRGSDGFVYHIRWSGSWGSWSRVPGMAVSSELALSSPARGTLEIYARHTDGSIWTTWRDDQAVWAPWYSLGPEPDAANAPEGPAVPAVAAVSRSGNSTDVFSASKTGTGVWQKTWTGSQWSGWTLLTQEPTRGLTAARGEADTAELWARLVDGRAWRLSVAPIPGGPRRTPGMQPRWQKLGGPIKHPPSEVRWGPGRRDLFATGAAGDLRHAWYEGAQWRLTGDA